MARPLRSLLAVCTCAVVVGGCGGSGGNLKPVLAPGAGKIVLGDDLEANGTRWVELDEGDFSVAVKGGDLVVATTRVGEGLIVAPDDLGVDVFESEVAAELEPGNPGPGALGVACRWTEDRWYALAIDDKGIASIKLWNAGTVTELGAASYTGRPSRIAGRCSGGGVDGGDATLQLLLDGSVVVEATDATGLGPGRAGVFVTATSEKKALTAKVDRFEVRELPGGTTRQEPPPPFPALESEGLTDDFSSAEAGIFGTLAIEDDLGGFHATYVDGGYRMRAADGFIQRSAAADPLPDHAVAEVTATKRSTGPMRYGLTWAQDEDRYYEMAIDDGVAIIGYVDGSRDGYVELARADGVTAILPGGTPNRLTTEFDRTSGSVRLTLSVNGTLVLEATDEDRWSTLHFAQLLVASTKDSTGAVDVVFDDYRLAAL